MDPMIGCKRQKARQCLFCVATPNSPLQTLALKAGRRHTLDWELALIGRRKKGKMTGAQVYSAQKLLTQGSMSHSYPG